MSDMIPIGSVVLIHGIESKIMIIGHYPKRDNSEVKDYLGVGYLRGIIEESECCMFNHEEINEILFKTELNEEDQQYYQMLTIFGPYLKNP